MTRLGKGRLSLILTLGLVASAQPILGQFDQYTPPGFFEPRREDTEKILERHISEARWKAGRLYLDPWVGMRDSGYRDPAPGTEESDVTITIGFGLRGWLPFGSDFTLAIHALPEYSWWKELSERNRWNGRYGVGLFGNLGRTGTELTVLRDDYATFFSREFEEQINTSKQQVGAKFEVELGAGFEVFLGGSLTSLDYDTEVFVNLPNPSVVDRDEDLASAGLNYDFPYGIKAGFGAEYSRAQFEPGPSDRSNSGTAPILLLAFEGTRLFLTADLAFRSLTPDGSSRFVDFDGLTGRFQLSWRTLERLELQLYGSNQLVYSFTDIWAYFEDSPIGVGVRYAFTRWLQARVFAETGSNDYAPFEADGPERTDDFDGWGASLQFQARQLRFGVQVSQTAYTSDLIVFDRKVRRFGFTVGWGAGDGMSWR